MRLLFICFMTFITQNSLAMNASIGKEKIIPVRTFSKEKNIYYALSNGKIVNATHSAIDHSPTLSSNKQIIAFLRESTSPIPQGCDDFIDLPNNHPLQIWTYNIKTKKENLLVANDLSCNIPERKIIDPDKIQFSPDNKKLYFVTSAWATSGALHSVNMDGTHKNYLMPANSYEILQKGQYKGYMLVLQHRYFIGEGSFDWYWLFTPQGKEIGSLGSKITKAQRKYIESEA